MSQAGRFMMGSGGAPIETLTGNVGGPVPPTGGNIDVVGTGVLSSTGNPGASTLTFELTDGNAGQLIIGGGGAGAAWADLQSIGGTIAITPGVNSLSIDVDSEVATEYDTDAGTAVPLNNVLIVIGSGGITTSGAGNTIAIDGSAVQMQWSVETLATPMVVNHGYIADNAAGVVFTLPAAAVVGDIIEVTGMNAGGWTIIQNAGQTIYYGAVATTTGGAGSLASTGARDSVRMVCVVDNLDFNVLSSQGNLNAA